MLPLPEEASDFSWAMAEKSLVNELTDRLAAGAAVVAVDPAVVAVEPAVVAVDDDLELPQPVRANPVSAATEAAAAKARVRDVDKEIPPEQGRRESGRPVASTGAQPFGLSWRR